MEFFERKLIAFDETKRTNPNITSATTTTVTRRTHTLMRKKRKLHFYKSTDMFKSRIDFLRSEIPAQTSANATIPTRSTPPPKSSSPIDICLLCRRPMTECCVKCMEAGEGYESISRRPTLHKSLEQRHFNHQISHTTKMATTTTLTTGKKSCVQHSSCITATLPPATLQPIDECRQSSQVSPKSQLLVSSTPITQPTATNSSNPSPPLPSLMANPATQRACGYSPHSHGTNDNNPKNHNQITTTKSAKSVSIRSVFRTFEDFILKQVQPLCSIFAARSKASDSRKPTNDNDNNSKRQPRRPLPSRLNFCHNSYFNNLTCNYNAATTATATAAEAANVTRTSPAGSPAQLWAYKARHQRRPLQHYSTQPHPRYFNMPNLSLLYVILIVLSFLSSFLPSTLAQSPQMSSLESSLTKLTASPSLPASASLTGSLPNLSPGVGDLALNSRGGTAPANSIRTKSKVTLIRPETVCKSLDLRNSPDFFWQLENCTVVEGFLLLALVNTHEKDVKDFNQTFPLLTEVTEFIVVYRVHNLRTLAQIFPNLSIIRGRTLFEGYSLVVYSNPHLEELGLTKLTTIVRGGVRIEDNLSLCFVETIDWNQIVMNSTDIFTVKNRAAIECPRCPGDNQNSQDGSDKDEPACREMGNEKRYCWNSKTCQKICPERCRNNCVDEKTCCNEACLGGCSPNNLNECTSCRRYSIYNNTCTDECPQKYFKYLDRRCLTADSCMQIATKFENNKQETVVPYNGTCLTRCPEGFTKIDGTCKKCDGKCEKKCVGGAIDSVARAKELQGCTHIIEQGLVISIKRGGRHLMEELAIGLSSIVVIETFLKVHLTFGMYSLEFFRNLHTINGKKLCENKFALYVLENNDLEKIWGNNRTVKIENGRVFFHFNPKLCYSEIETLRGMMVDNAPFDKNEVATDSNGYRGSCNTEYLNTTIEKVFPTIAICNITTPLVFEDARTFIGYQFFYIEDKYKNATKHGFRPCDDGWIASEATKDVTYVFNGLEPFTQYAYYVKTMTISSEPRNAQSPIQYFITKPSKPKNVQKVTAYSNSSSEIVVTWQRPKHVYGNLTTYRVRAVLDSRPTRLETRDYCKDPSNIHPYNLPEKPAEKPTPAPPSADCKCSKDKDANYDSDDNDGNLHDRIDFENTLQNFVYVKQTNDSTENKTDQGSEDSNNASKRRRRSLEGDSFLLRHIRAMPDELDFESTTSSTAPTTSATTTKTTAVPSNSNATTAVLPKNATLMDPKGEYFYVRSDTVNASTTEYVFKHLKHFSIYMLAVSACRAPDPSDNVTESEEKTCSDESQIYVRTRKLDNVDQVRNLQVVVETGNNTMPQVRLRWDPPERPNGAVVSYTIYYTAASEHSVEEKKCITELEYRNLTGGYILKNLVTGYYDIKVRANSLAGEGLLSKTFTINIPPTTMSSTTIAMICVGVILLVILLATSGYGGFRFFKNKYAPPTDFKCIPTVNPYYISLQYIPDDWEVARESVIQYSPLGQGSFGMVYEGVLKRYTNSNEDTPCAIKTVNENATDRERMNFLNEASVMKQFDTYHVVRLLGVCSRGQPALVIMELMKNGDLKSYLRAHRPDEREDGLQGMLEGGVGGASSQPPPLSRIYQMAIEIADGMAYLSAKKFVHRDLAARNCMVAADLTVKIGDFGMTRDIYETDYYRKGTKGLLPVRWMPPESLRDGVYSSSSDVFSFGVVLWEMATLASQPYQGLSNDQVLRYVIDGGVMERPENCPDELYRLMQKCWHHRPTARPTFMQIISYLMDMADGHFKEVSFYHSEEGQVVRNKELAENIQHSGDIFNDHDNDLDDATTPLRVGEYNDYKLNMDNNSSVENQGDSPMVNDEGHPHSPYSLGSAAIVSSTPDGQSKNSFNLSQMSHNNPTPSTSTGMISGSQQRPHHQPFHGRYAPQQHQAHGDEAAAYVQPDEFEEDEEEAGATVTSKSVDTDERGYEIYDPSPNYREHAPYNADDDDEADFRLDSERSGKLSGGQNLLPRQKGHTHKVPTVVPMSSSMPDEVTSAPMSSSLHPSTASAASSNASSTTTAPGKLPSLKKAMADTVHNAGNSLMPALLRNNINFRFFKHKRSGSNASHKSTSSNPASSNSNTNLTGSSGRGKSTSGQNLGTIESGGSGSAGSYTATPRFFTPSAGLSTSENPNYKLLDETANSSVISAAEAAADAANRSNPPSGYVESDWLRNELLKPTATPTKSGFAFGAPMNVSNNPNYTFMQAPPSNIPYVKTKENPNYQLMEAPASYVEHEEKPAPFTYPRSFHSSSSSESEFDFDEHAHTEHIKMERVPLSRRRSSERKRGNSRSHSHSRSRSRSQSQTKTDEGRQPPANAPGTGTITGGAQPTSTFSLKERWLRQQQAQPPPPPPNGFIGREA